MKKLLILISLTLLFSCTQVQQKDDTAPDANIATTNTGVVAAQTDGLTDIMSQISLKYSENKGFNMCVKQHIDNCMQEFAYEGDTKMECDDFVLEDNRNFCKQSQTISNAVQKNDVSLCDTLISGKEDCKFEVVVAKGLENYNTEVCSGLEESYKASCYNQIIRAQSRDQKDVKLCDAFLGSEEDLNIEKEFCVQEIEYIIEKELREELLKEEEKKTQEGLELENQ